jgi:FPC/CPF motif-containing protein YcgG
MNAVQFSRLRFQSIFQPQALGKNRFRMMRKPNQNDDVHHYVQAKQFPCVAAKSAAQGGNITQCSYNQLTESGDDDSILKDLHNFVAGGDNGVFRSFVATFGGISDLSETEFEAAMWNRLQALHDLDVQTHGWDRSVSCDPSSPGFSFSLGGKAFFIIGLHPNASRLSRRYHCAALVFNLHEQFEALRRGGRYERMREVIRRRDAALCGSPNPALRNFGEQSEARQYSGRAVPDNWRCPFRSHGRRRRSG